MSASPIARQATQGQAIPKRIVINDPSQLPHDYSSTPGGTLYSTTPGGTRIIYDRASLLQMRNSPLAQTPPKNLPNLPAQILQNGQGKEQHGKPSPLATAAANKGTETAKEAGDENKDKILEEPQFEMDI